MKLNIEWLVFWALTAIIVFAVLLAFNDSKASTAQEKSIASEVQDLKARVSKLESDSLECSWPDVAVKKHVGTYVMNHD